LIEEEKKKFKFPWYVILEIIVAIIAIVLLVGYLMGWYKMGGVSDVGAMVKIPAATFKFQDGREVTVGDFYLDKYEVTIDQYARFLEDVEKNPNLIQKVAGMPSEMKLKPEDWDNMLLAARNGSVYQNQQLRGDCPVFNVNWWAACCDAAWAGKRLPREEEWELAMGGGKNKFPWGNDVQWKKVNFGKDYDPDPNKRGKIDGFIKWAPVGASKTDKSPYGVMDMAGNVAEWTLTPSTHLHLPSEQVYVIRGASYVTQEEELKDGVLMRTRTIAPLRGVPSVGFRCASDKYVEPKK